MMLFKKLLWQRKETNGGPPRAPPKKKLIFKTPRAAPYYRRSIASTHIVGCDPCGRPFLNEKVKVHYRGPTK